MHQIIEHPDFKEALKVQRSLGEGSSRSSTVQITSVQPQCKQDNQYTGTLISTVAKYFTEIIQVPLLGTH